MVYGNLISLTFYTILVLLVAIFTGESTLYIISFINIIILIRNFTKNKKKTTQIKENNNKVISIKEQARINIEKKYQNKILSAEEKRELVREEFINLMIKEND